MASASKDAWFSKSDEEKTAILDLMYKEYKPPTPTGRSTGSKHTPIRLPSEEDIKKDIERRAMDKARLDDRLERVKYYNKYRTSLSNAEIFGMYEEDQRQKSQIFLEKYREDKMKQKMKEDMLSSMTPSKREAHFGENAVDSTPIESLSNDDLTIRLIRDLPRMNTSELRMNVRFFTPQQKKDILDLPLYAARAYGRYLVFKRREAIEIDNYMKRKQSANPRDIALHQQNLDNFYDAHSKRELETLEKDIVEEDAALKEKETSDKYKPSSISYDPFDLKYLESKKEKKTGGYKKHTKDKKGNTKKRKSIIKKHTRRH